MTTKFRNFRAGDCFEDFRWDRVNLCGFVILEYIFSFFLPPLHFKASEKTSMHLLTSMHKYGNMFLTFVTIINVS